jgi:hypothetical protein
MATLAEQSTYHFTSWFFVVPLKTVVGDYEGFVEKPRSAPVLVVDCVGQEDGVRDVNGTAILRTYHCIVPPDISYPALISTCEGTLFFLSLAAPLRDLQEHGGV